jgi:hypothetical protein
VNISLGYSKGYNDPDENYSPNDMDGKTSMIARAIDTAFFNKNMLVVVAAGNEGTDPEWEILSTPGDAIGALTVGSNKLKIREKLPYSSIGPDFLGYLKPNVSCFATQGTSFSTPIITGIAACIMELDSTLSSVEIKNIIEGSSGLFPYGNNYTGYGTPDCEKILQKINESIPYQTHTIESRKKSTKIRIADNARLVVYHKIGINVIHVEKISSGKKEEKIMRYEDATSSTVFLEGKSLEIIWKKL